MTARETATAAVGTRHHFLHLFDPRVFLHLELFSHNVKDDGQDEAENCNNRNSPDNC